jgi:hypothetical protein
LRFAALGDFVGRNGSRRDSMKHSKITFRDYSSSPTRRMIAHALADRVSRVPGKSIHDGNRRYV